MPVFKFLLAGLLIGLTSLASSASVVRLSAVGDPTVGSSFSVQLDLDQPFDGLVAGAKLLSFGFALNYDNSALKLSGFIPEAGWDDDTMFLDAGQFGGSNFPGVANVGQTSLHLATLTFEVLTGGPTLLEFSSDPADFNLGLYYSGERGARPLEGSLLVSPTELPEPTSVLLMLAGLMSLGLVKRRAG